MNLDNYLEEYGLLWFYYGPGVTYTEKEINTMNLEEYSEYSRNKIEVLGKNQIAPYDTIQIVDVEKFIEKTGAKRDITLFQDLKQKKNLELYYDTMRNKYTIDRTDEEIIVNALKANKELRKKYLLEFSLRELYDSKIIDEYRFGYELRKELRTLLMETEVIILSFVKTIINEMQKR